MNFACCCSPHTPRNTKGGCSAMMVSRVWQSVIPLTSSFHFLAVAWKFVVYPASELLYVCVGVYVCVCVYSVLCSACVVEQQYLQGASIRCLMCLAVVCIVQYLWWKNNGGCKSYLTSAWCVLLFVCVVQYLWCVEQWHLQCISQPALDQVDVACCLRVLFNTCGVRLTVAASTTWLVLDLDLEYLITVCIHVAQGMAAVP